MYFSNRTILCLNKFEHQMVLGDYNFFDSSIYAVWPPNRHQSAKVRAFVDFLAVRFGGLPY
jgi:DNA-binding transcriptional LysR family regulator